MSEQKQGSAQKILIAARDEFAEYGLAGARVDRIARRAEVNKAMIYYHYGSKDELYQAVIREHLGRIGEYAASQYANFTNIETLLANIAKYMHTMFCESRSFVPIFLREAASGGERIIREFNAALTDKGLTKVLRSFIDNGKAQGQFRDIDTVQAIVSFIGMNMFYILMSTTINAVWEIDNEEAFRAQRQKEVVDLFLYGLKKR